MSKVELSRRGFLKGTLAATGAAMAAAEVQRLELGKTGAQDCSGTD